MGITGGTVGHQWQVAVRNIEAGLQVIFHPQSDVMHIYDDGNLVGSYKIELPSEGEGGKKEYFVPEAEQGKEVLGRIEADLRKKQAAAAI